MSRSKLNPSQITQMTYDETSNANRVKIADTELAMELSHTDGDSVTAHPAKLTASVTGVTLADNGTDVIPATDCSSLTQVRVDLNGTGAVVVKVSPSDTANVWYDLGASGTTYNICARRVKVTSTNLVGAAYLVGRG